MRLRKRGFTLIELVAVLVILGVVAVVAVPQFLDLRSQARSSVANIQGGQIAAAFTQASTTNYFKNKGASTGSWIYTCMQGHRFVWVLPGANGGDTAPLGGGYTVQGYNGGLQVRDHQGVDYEWFNLSVKNPVNGDPWDAANEMTSGDARTCTITSTTSGQTSEFQLWGCTTACAVGY